MAQEYSFLEQVNQAFDTAAALTEHDPTVLTTIKAVNSVYHMQFPILRDDGSIEVILQVRHRGRSVRRGQRRHQDRPAQVFRS